MMNYEMINIFLFTPGGLNEEMFFFIIYPQSINMNKTEMN